MARMDQYSCGKLEFASLEEKNKCVYQDHMLIRFLLITREGEGVKEEFGQQQSFKNLTKGQYQLLHHTR